MTIIRRIILVLISTTTVVLGGLGVYDVIQLRSKSRAQLDHTATAMGIRLATSASKALYQLDDAVMGEAIRGEFGDPLLLAALIFDGTGPDAKLFSASQRGPDGAVAPATKALQLPELVTVEREVMYEGKPIGRVIVQVDGAAAAAELRLASWMILARTIGLNVVLVLVLVIAIRRTVVRPILQVSRLMAAVAEGDGDLTARLPEHGRDEIAAVGRSFNIFVTKLQELMREIAAASDRLGSSATSLDSTAGTLSAGIAETDKRGREATAAGHQVDTSIQSVSAAVHEMSSTSKEIASRTVETANLAREAKDAAGQGQAAIGKLAGSSAQVGEVLNLITTIASQVNLLSLNATIEAASAGEAGRGFAVVANEVKELARRTAIAADDIKNKVDAIRTDTAAVGAAITRIDASVNKVDDSATAIAAAAEEQSATIGEMSENINRVASSSQEIAGAIAGVGTQAEQATIAAGTTRATASAVSGDAGALRGLIGRFRY